MSAGPAGDSGDFLAEVRAWLAAHVPAAPLPPVDTREGFAAHREWERALASARLSVVSWPDAARRAARAALQVHGAMGYTEEHDLHLWLLKVRALTGAWGSQSQHRARVMAAIAQGEPAWS